MSTDYNNNNYNVNDDPYAVDTEKVIAETENRGGSSDRPKVKWHNLPEGDATSAWRILPYPKRRSFFFKVTKHWHVPGFKGSITCPRSFDDPSNGKKYRCAICEKFFEMLKSKDPADVAIAKQVLRSSQSYYCNAINMAKPEEGVGVLNLPYNAWKTLYDWLSNPRLQMFSHPFRGRNVEIKSSSVPGSSIPGKPGTQKREYTVMPDDVSEIANKEWLEQLYDLETVVGIPTFELTEVCLARLLAGDESAAKLPEGVPAFRGQLMAPKTEETPNNVATEREQEQWENPNPPVDNAMFMKNTPPPMQMPMSEMPKFGAAPTESTLNKPQPVVPNPQDELAALRARLAQLEGTGTAPAPTQTVATPVQAPQSEDDIRKMMEAALGGSLKK